MEQTPTFRRVHVVINPASGKDQPILNTLNDVFHQHGVEWDVSITHKYGDATAQAKDAIARGVDLVVGYGGDGTQHELANAVIGTETPMAVLPGGTGIGLPAIRGRVSIFPSMARTPRRLAKKKQSMTRRRAPELTFQQPIADCLVRGHCHIVLDQTEVTDTEHCTLAEKRSRIMHEHEVDCA